MDNTQWDGQITGLWYAKLHILFIQKHKSTLWNSILTKEDHFAPPIWIACIDRDSTVHCTPSMYPHLRHSLFIQTVLKSLWLSLETNWLL